MGMHLKRLGVHPCASYAPRTSGCLAKCLVMPLFCETKNILKCFANMREAFFKVGGLWAPFFGKRDTWALPLDFFQKTLKIIAKKKVKKIAN